jgi:hypothetical protein
MPFYMAVSNKTVYIAGYYDEGNGPKPCYWADGVRTDLPEGTYVSSITVYNDMVYVLGFYFDGISKNNACYWEMERE